MVTLLHQLMWNNVFYKKMNSGLICHIICQCTGVPGYDVIVQKEGIYAPI